jgi:hypothetical protein
MPKQKAIKKQKDFEFKKYDIDLKEEFTLKVPVPENSELKNYDCESDYLYALFET